MPIVAPSLAHPSLTEPTYVRPPIWKPVLAWAGLALGGLVTVAAVATLGGGVLESVAMALIGLAAALSGGWWLYCEHADRGRAEEDFALDRQAELAGQAMAGYVAPEALGPLTWDTLLTPFPRRWPAVGSAAAALLVGGVALMPAATPTAVPAADPVSRQAPVTSTVTSTARATPPTTTVTQTATTTASAEPTPVAEPVADPAAAQPPAESVYTPAPRTTYAPAPAPVAEPAPQSTYYKNCTAVRAAGAAPIYRGQAGYASHLDRDGDGVACE